MYSVQVAFLLELLVQQADVTWLNYSILSVNDHLTPVTPNDPRLTLDPIT